MPAPGRRLAVYLVCAALLTLWATGRGAREFGWPRIGIDDANISMVYGRNLVAGHGFVFDPGQERVEGFTSLAWVLVMAAGYALTESPERLFLAVSMLLSCFCVFAALTTAGELTVAAAGETAVPGAARALGRNLATFAGSLVLAAAWIAVQPAFFVWTTITLMDVALWAALIHAGVLVLALDAMTPEPSQRSVWILAGISGLMILTRPEAILVAPGLIALGALAETASTHRWRESAERFAPALVVCLATLAGLVAFRLAYFGYPLPNTYYAKVPPDRIFAAREGASYVWGYLEAHPLAAALVAGAAVVLWLFAIRARAHRWRFGPSARMAFVGCAAMLVGLALPLAVGGDHFGSHRFLQPFVPMLILPAVYGWAVTARTMRAVPTVVLASAVGLVAAFSAASLPSAWHRFATASGLHTEFTIAEHGRRLGEAMNRLFPEEPRPRVAQVITGGFGLVYRGRLIDLTGLNWTEMGHSPGPRRGFRNHAAFDEEVFWKAAPDIVIPRISEGRPRYAAGVADQFSRMIVRNIDRSDRFRSHYDAGYVESEDGGQVVSGFFAKAWLQAADLGRFTRVPWERRSG